MLIARIEKPLCFIFVPGSASRAAAQTLNLTGGYEWHMGEKMSGDFLPQPGIHATHPPGPLDAGIPGYAVLRNPYNRVYSMWRSWLKVCTKQEPLEDWLDVYREELKQGSTVAAMTEGWDMRYLLFEDIESEWLEFMSEHGLGDVTLCKNSYRDPQDYAMTNEASEKIYEIFHEDIHMHGMLVAAA